MRHDSLQKLGTVAGLFLALAACQQVPNPDDGKFSATAPEPPKPVVPPYVLVVPEQMSFVEGQSMSYEITAKVPAPGVPVVEVSGLPAGAVFSQKDLKITWQPDYSAAGNPSAPEETERGYPVRVVMRSSLDNITTVERSRTLVVKDVLRPLVIRTDSVDLTVNEGEKITSKFKVVSQDFPVGPFEVRGKGLPAGAVIQKDRNDPTLFTFLYSPDFTVAKADRYGDPAEVDFVVTAIGPRNQQLELPVALKIVDVRRQPSLSAPANLLSGSDVSIPVSSIDPNGEVSPEISVDPQPDFGRVRLQNKAAPLAIRGTQLPTSGAVVVWDQIPTSKMGVPQSLHLKTCVQDSREEMRNCVSREVLVTFSANPHAAPVIGRDAWPAGKIHYTRVADPLKVALPVTDPEDSNAAVAVEILPADLREQVQWKDGALTITPKTEGLMQFDVLATSGFGVKQRESFVLKSLPASWSKTLILGESLKDSEIVFAMKVFPDAQVANPALQGFDDGVLALRRSLFVGTSALGSGAGADVIARALKKVPNVVVGSPLISKLPADFMADDITRVGRFLDLSGLPGLSALRLTPAKGSGLDLPQNPLRLTQALTPESVSPMMLAAGKSGLCYPVINLEGPAGLSLTTALGCDMKDGGRMLISGFEWADAAETPADKGVVAKWLKKWVE